MRGLACNVVLALGWLSFAGPDNLAAPLRIAVPVVVWAAALVFLWRLSPALSAVGTEATVNDGQVGLLKAAVTASRDGVMIAEIDPTGAAGPKIVYANPAFERIDRLLGRRGGRPQPEHPLPGQLVRPRQLRPG